MSTPFVPGLTGSVTPAALDDSWLTWAATADDADQLELAETLLATTPLERQSIDLGVARARLLLLQGRPADALADLGRLGLADMSADGPRSWSELVVVAARAATGDMSSFQRLVETASRTAGEPQAWRAAYLIAAAAEQTGRPDIAHQAWRTLALTHRIVTPLTVSRLAAGEVARRDHVDQHAIAAVVMTQARNLSQLVPGPADDPGPTLAAAKALRAHGDEAGARLLLHAVSRLNAPNAEISAALSDGVPIRAQRLHRAKVVGASLLAIPLIPAGLVAVLIVWGARRLWERYVRLPGLSLPDSIAWRSIGAVPPGSMSGSAQAATAQQGYGWYLLAGVAGVIAWMPFGFTASEAAARALGGETDTQSIIYLLGLVSLPTLLILGTRVIRRKVVGARLRSRAASAQRRRLAEAEQCRCWQTRGLSGDLAEAYGVAHLVPVQDPATVEVLRRRLGPHALVGQCPVTGTVWLGGDLGRGGTAVQLRGNVPAAPDVATVPAGGFYL